MIFVLQNLFLLLVITCRNHLLSFLNSKSRGIVVPSANNRLKVYLLNLHLLCVSLNVFRRFLRPIFCHSPKAFYRAVLKSLSEMNCFLLLFGPDLEKHFEIKGFCRFLFLVKSSSKFQRFLKSFFLPFICVNKDKLLLSL